MKILTSTVLENPYIPHDPTPKQAEFLLSPEKEVLYGGAAGGGKSDALLMGALQYVHVPGYAAILFRRTFADLKLPEALIPRSHEWLNGTDAKWSEQDKTWYFPSGATLSFGYLEYEKHKYRYQSSAFQFIGFDELTQFTESQYRYLFSRLRRLKGADVPLRMRSATNPGGEGHEWVSRRFDVFEKGGGKTFIPAKLEDNPHLDTEEYLKSLKELDPVTREQLKDGDWNVKEKGNMFKREWFEIVDNPPADVYNVVRYWDLAATEKEDDNDPAFTAGVKMGEKDGIYYIYDIKRARARPAGVENLIKQTAQIDGRNVSIWIEQEPGSSGVNTIDHYQRRVLKGYTVRGDKVTGKKELRAQPLSAAAEAGNVKLVRGSWIDDFLDEVEVFPLGKYKDQVDCSSGALSKLTKEESGYYTQDYA